MCVCVVCIVYDMYTYNIDINIQKYITAYVVVVVVVNAFNLVPKAFIMKSQYAQYVGHAV